MSIVALFALASSAAPIADVRVGDDGHTSRVEVVCSASCSAEPMGESSFLIVSARADFSADVSSRSEYIRRISMSSSREGTALTVEAASLPRAISVTPCGPNRLCFDYEFSAATPSPRRATVDTVEADLDRLLSRTGLATAAPQAVMAAADNETGCRAAERALSQDAWNLFAYRTVALCRARQGQPEEGARLMIRLDSFAANAAEKASPSARHSALR
ncbi:hypothetical protein [Parvularcula sp. LCG005]|uniref:hypothetical protein n=1 Tax=Parvularcula sp. LCG005 TaxID=3078805 RepID=UPI002943613A|nr:hypothetical protein [Parvularcula sp. LCG005]WOI52805.1 hypothetical protein RUI03_11670 [Parvularcula sp. LCG005]